MKIGRVIMVSHCIETAPCTNGIHGIFRSRHQKNERSTTETVFCVYLTIHEYSNVIPSKIKKKHKKGNIKLFSNVFDVKLYVYINVAIKVFRIDFYLSHVLKETMIWGLRCQRQVSQAGISNYIPQ